MSYPYWDLPTALLYLVQGVVAALALQQVKQRENKINYVGGGGILK